MPPCSISFEEICTLPENATIYLYIVQKLSSFKWLKSLIIIIKKKKNEFNDIILA